MSIVRRLVVARAVAFWAALGLNCHSSIPAIAAEYTDTSRQPTPAELASLKGVVPEKAAALIKDVKAPADFDVTIFATPPAVNYPVFLAAAPDGTLYVSSDGNGSLDRKPHMGRVLRVRDLDGDGRADEVKAFVPDVDSPRGLVWDHDRVYLLHPPDITEFIDRDGDGVADEKRTLVKGIGWTFKDRPADHASNGLELGIDGWLYAAIGDFGFMEAVGTDGTKLQLRGGGVVRVRPDGSGLELWADGTRNILEVAMSPLLDGFARDNTNDGGGWDVRFHHFSGITQHGYPRLFKNFADEIITPLADYGGGSGCGAAWIDEPGIPARWNNSPFTADWGRDWIYHHGVKPNGATFTATQEEFLRLPRVTDLDVDASGSIYASSWKGASFTWVGPDVGFIARVTAKGAKPVAVPDFNTLAPAGLVDLLSSASHRTRLAAQRELIRRHRNGSAWSSATEQSLRELAAKTSAPLPGRIAAVFAIQQSLGTAASGFLTGLLSDPTIAAWSLRAIGDRADIVRAASRQPITDSLQSSDPRVRKEAIIALVRLGDAAPASSLTALLSDSDPIVAHTAVQGLVRLHALKPCLQVIDSPGSPKNGVDRAFQVIQSLPTPATVDALLSRLTGENKAASSNVEIRHHILTALCRLHFVEGPWKGDSWGTRPDTRGPLYQPEKWSETERISAAIRTALDVADAGDAAFIGRELSRHRIPAGDALEKLIARAATEPSLLPAIAAQLAQAEEVPAAGVPLLIRTASDKSTADAARAQAVIALAKTTSEDGWRALLRALPIVQRTQSENNLAEKARGAVMNAPRLDTIHGVLEEQAAKVEGESSQLAETLLLKLASRKLGAPEARESAAKSIDAGWGNPQRRVQILQAAAKAGDASRAAQFVSAIDDADPTISKAAKEAVKSLKIDPAKFRAEAKLPKIGELKLEDVLKEVVGMKGEISRGEQLFAQVGCNGCHTVRADEPLKGPFLGTVSTIFRRRELAEAILYPNKTIAQGFVANHFELKDGSEVDGFVVREAADAVTVRTITAQEQTIPVGTIAKREKQERSLMPEGIAAGITVHEFASLLDYLESLSNAAKEAAIPPGWVLGCN